MYIIACQLFFITIIVWLIIFKITLFETLWNPTQLLLRGNMNIIFFCESSKLNDSLSLFHRIHLLSSQVLRVVSHFDNGKVNTQSPCLGRLTVDDQSHKQNIIRIICLLKRQKRSCQWKYDYVRLTWQRHVGKNNDFILFKAKICRSLELRPWSQTAWVWLSVLQLDKVTSPCFNLLWSWNNDKSTNSYWIV